MGFERKAHTVGKFNGWILLFPICFGLCIYTHLRVVNCLKDIPFPRDINFFWAADVRITNLPPVVAYLRRTRSSFLWRLVLSSFCDRKIWYEQHAQNTLLISCTIRKDGSWWTPLKPMHSNKVSKTKQTPWLYYYRMIAMTYSMLLVWNKADTAWYLYFTIRGQYKLREYYIMCPLFTNHRSKWKKNLLLTYLAIINELS